MQTSPMQSQRPDSIGLRLPPGMKERIRAAAAADRRTITSWIEKTLADALEHSETKGSN